jgi:uncharacterized protein
MMTQSFEAYQAFDRPEILQVLFHPRPEMGRMTGSRAFEDVMIEVTPGIRVGGCFHPAATTDPTLLFFHGNGEIVADYDEMAPLFVQQGVGFWVVDYRGYGRSEGRPTVSGMMQDAHAIFAYVQKWLADRGHFGPLAVMGRSLGSASAVELAASYPDQIRALIIESGFASPAPLLRLLGIDVQTLGIDLNGLRNVDKIKQYQGPTLIIHGEYDHIIACDEGRELFEASSSSDKRFLKIEGANHNDLFFRGMTDYLDAIKHLVYNLTTV